MRTVDELSQYLITCEDDRETNLTAGEVRLLTDRTPQQLLTQFLHACQIEHLIEEERDAHYVIINDIAGKTAMSFIFEPDGTFGEYSTHYEEKIQELQDQIEELKPSAKVGNAFVLLSGVFRAASVRDEI